MFAAVTSKISGLLARDSEDEDADEAPAPRRSRQHSIDRASRTTARRLQGRAGPAAEGRSSAPNRRGRGTPARRRPRSSSPWPSVPAGPGPPAGRPSRRFHRPSRVVGRVRASAREPRKQPPPSDRRSPYQRPDRHSRFDGFEPFEPHGTSGSNGSGSLNGTHHPISRVRYRGADDGDQRPEYRSRPRTSRHQADAWEYDV